MIGTGGLRVVERLDGLRHDAVVGRDHQDGDVGDLGAAGAHGGEGLVAGRVDERDLAVPACAWYAPMCCVIPPNSPATTSVSRIASRSFVFPWSTWPMIVTTGGAGNQRGFVDVLRDLGLGLVVLHAHDLRVVTELGGDHPDRLVGERGGGGDHLPGREQDLHDLGGRPVQLVGDRLRRRAPDEAHHRAWRARRLGRGGGGAACDIGLGRRGGRNGPGSGAATARRRGPR